MVLYSKPQEQGNVHHTPLFYDLTQFEDDG